MKKCLKILLVFSLIALLCQSVAAADQVERSGVYAVVNEDGSCQISMTVSLFMEVPDRTMRFPIPYKAQDVQLNGTSVGTYRSGSYLYVDLSGAISTDMSNISFTLSYQLPKVISQERGKWLVKLPLLSGFQLPIAAMDFTVTLPGQSGEKPTFSSGYHQSSIESFLSWNISGNVISGRTLQELNDYETLQMQVLVDEGMFSQSSDYFLQTIADDSAILVCFLLAAVYWLLFMATKLPKLHRYTQPPHGYTAGHFSTILTLGGADLSLMVMSWAQMGYVLLERKPSGGILVHKTMDMGNERSSFDQQIFKKLFSKRSFVDTGSLAYATLCASVEKQTAPAKLMAHKRNGNPLIFRLLIAAAGGLSGINLGLSLGQNVGGQIIFAILLFLCGFAAAWLMLQAAQGLLLYRPRNALRGLVAGIAWVCVFALFGKFNRGLFLVLLTLLFGVFATYGGKRSEEGQRCFEQLLGLARYFYTADRAQLSHILKNDPEYFHNMAPYALALGADLSFARRMGKEKLPDCPYLVGLPQKERNAVRWSEVYRRTLNVMNSRYMRLKTEQLQKAALSLRK